MHIHPAHAPHSVPALKPYPDKLWVVTAIANPMRYHSRYRLYRAFEKQIADSGAELVTVEMAFGGREFEVTQCDNAHHIRVRGQHELWYKENLLNLGIARLPPEAQYIAIVDADFTFARPDWAQETLQQLQHYQAVQMYSDIQYIGPESQPVSKGQSYVQLWLEGKLLRGVNGSARHVSAKCPPEYGYGYGAGRFAYGPPGGAWAFRREALDRLGGLIDFVIHGGGDHYMTLALIGQLELFLPGKFHECFKHQLMEWQRRAERHIRRNVGVVPGLVIHHWHGKKINRKYSDRVRIVIDNDFNPLTDIKRDAQGLWQLEDDGSERFLKLRDGLRNYFRTRSEDSIDL